MREDGFVAGDDGRTGGERGSGLNAKMDRPEVWENITEIRREEMHRARDILDGYGLVDAVLIEQIDHVDAETLQRLVRHLPDALLPAAYRHAHAFVFPSRYEGFGLPIPEAMSVGAAVVCGNNSGMPEAAGDAQALCQVLEAPESSTERLVPEVTGLLRQASRDGEIRLTYGELTALIADAVKHLRD